MVSQAMLKKVQNGAGNYSMQYVEDGKIKICSFRSYEDGITFAFFKWGLDIICEMSKCVILGKEDLHD